MNHPEHHAMIRLSGGYMVPSQPEKAGWWTQYKRERACHKAGGHWWHPADGMIDWFCCQCGKETDGMPEDGSSR